MPAPMTAEKFWGQADRSGDCWLWLGTITYKGYGRTGWKGEFRFAHRLAYELVKGPIPEGLQIDHLCRVRRCINPAHMEAVTARENAIRGRGNGNRDKTHCPKGHPYEGGNLYAYEHGERRWKARACRECCRTRAREWWRARHPGSVHRV